MKTNTTVSISDYLELYEFKKSYDRGEKVQVIITSPYSGVNRTEILIPVSEVDEKLKNSIDEYVRFSSIKIHEKAELADKQELKREIQRLERENKTLLKYEQIQNATYVEIENLQFKLSDMRSAKNWFRAAFYISLVAIIILLFT